MGPIHRFTVEVERGLPVPAARLAAIIERILADPRSWGATGPASFRRVGSGPVSLRILLARPAWTDCLCAPLPTNGRFSCFRPGRVVLNFRRWREGAATYGRTRHGYRHSDWPGPIRRAPAMMQQAKRVAPCRPNP